MKSDMLVKLVLVFFISLLSFSIGTFVGKKFSDNQYKMANLEGQTSDHHEVADTHEEKAADDHGTNAGHEAQATAHDTDRETASVPHNADVKPSKALTDEEIAKLAEEFVTDDKPTADAHGTTPQAEKHDVAPAHGEVHAPVAKSNAKKVEHAPSPAAEKIVAGHAPVEDHHAAAKVKVPTDLPKQVAANAANKFTVQVASYALESEAQKLAGDLKAKGYNAFYVSADVKGQTWYRVSVGLFSSQKEAVDYKTELVNNAKLTSAIVQKISGQ